MSGDLPAPPVPAACDLRDFPFYQVEVARLRDSGLAVADAEEFRCSVLSWCFAWHQLPAGSLPDDDASLARALGFGRDVKGWKKIRAAGGLRGWVKHADGRLYHPVVTEKVLAAWQRKLVQRWQTECSRIKKHNQRHGTDVPCPAFEAWLSAGCPQGQMLPVPGESQSKGQLKGQLKGEGQGQLKGEGQGQGDSYTPPPPPGDEPSRAGGGVDRTAAAAAALAQRVRGFDTARVLAAIQAGNLLGVVAAYGANALRGDEWRRESVGMAIGEVAVVLDWAMWEKRPIREPSGFRAELVRWKARTLEERKGYLDGWREVMGLEVPGEDQAQGVEA